VIAKVAQADAVIWLDETRYTTPGFVNRNRLRDGTWLTVPVERRDHRSLIKEVVIGAPGWQDEHTEILLAHYESAPHFDRQFLAYLHTTLTSPGFPLADLNIHLIREVMNRLGLGHIASSRASDYAAARAAAPLSTKIGRMVKEAGGTVYLSGPTNRLDADLLRAEGVELAFFNFAGENPSVVDPLFRHGALPASHRQTVSGVEP
jgi:WbqC-like protein family